MLRLYRLNFQANISTYWKVWKWMHQQPELYSQVVGFENFQEFVKHPGEQIDFALRENGELIAFASLVLRSRKVCEFELITPARPRVRSILTLCREWQRQYFEDLRFVALFARYPDDPRFDRPRRLCRLFGWREPTPNYFEFTIHDFLRSNNGQETAAAQSQSASAV